MFSAALANKFQRNFCFWLTNCMPDISIFYFLKHESELQILTQKCCCASGRRQPKDIPQPILTYNEYMGGVDLHDQHRSYYPVGRSCSKWWRYIFWFVVNSSLVNSWIILKKTMRPEVKSRKIYDPLEFRLNVYQGQPETSPTTSDAAFCSRSCHART